MDKGDIVIAEHPDSKSSKLIRSYGIVHEVTKTGNVIIEMADGTKIKRRYSAVAVFTKPPSNWKELYRQQNISSKPRHRMMLRSSANRN